MGYLVVRKTDKGVGIIHDFRSPVPMNVKGGIKSSSHSPLLADSREFLSTYLATGFLSQIMTSCHCDVMRIGASV